MSDYPILTPRLRTAGKDYIGSNCSMFFPMDEGSGDTITDLVKGYQFEKAGSVFTTPHAIKQSWLAGDRNDSLTLTSDATKHLLFFLVGQVDLSAGAFTFSLGTSTSFSLGLNASSFNINSSLVDPALNPVISVAMDTIVSTDVVLVAGTLNKDTGEIRSYNGINGAVVFANTDDASGHIPVYSSMANNLALGSGLAQYYMSAGVLYLNSLPAEADLLDMLEVTRQNIIAGHKWYDPRLSNY